MTYYKEIKLLANSTITTKTLATMITTSGRSLMRESVDSSKNLNSPAEEGGCGVSWRLFFFLLISQSLSTILVKLKMMNGLFNLYIHEGIKEIQKLL